MSHHALSIVLSLWMACVAHGYAGGSGTTEDPYQIASAQHLIALGAEPNDYAKHFVLISDIDLSGRPFNRAVIAHTSNLADPSQSDFQSISFSGSFDGGGHVIRHLTIDGAPYAGLFGQLDGGAIVANLRLEAVRIHGIGFFAGGLAARITEGVVLNCDVTGTVNGFQYVGGLIGDTAGEVSRCSSFATVGGYRIVGGLIGSNTGSVSDCNAIAKVTGTQNTIGGLTGINQGTVSWSHSAGPVIGRDYTGGLVGENGDASGIVGCYSLGDVVGDDSTGGLVGRNRGTISSSYSTGSVVGDDYVGGLVGENLAHVANNFSTGAVAGDTHIGGLIGADGRHGNAVLQFEPRQDVLEKAAFGHLGRSRQAQLLRGGSRRQQTAPDPGQSRSPAGRHSPAVTERR